MATLDIDDVLEDKENVHFLRPHPAIRHIIDAYGIFRNHERIAIHFTDALRLTACQFLVSFYHQEIFDHVKGKFSIIYLSRGTSETADHSNPLNELPPGIFKAGRFNVDPRFAAKNSDIFAGFRADSAYLSAFICNPGKQAVWGKIREAGHSSSYLPGVEHLLDNTNR